jgi:hypothetical protein
LRCHKKGVLSFDMPIGNRHWTFTPLVVSGAPEEPGVYALFEGDEVIYYGCVLQGSTIRSALYEVLQRVQSGHAGCLQGVSRYTWEISYRPRLREAELLREFEQEHQHPPRCNEAAGARLAAAPVAGRRRVS